MHYNFTLTEIPQNNSKIICPELLVKFNEIFNLKKKQKPVLVLILSIDFATDFEECFPFRCEKSV